MSDAVGFHLRTMSVEDREEVSRLIFYSTNQYYRSIGRDEIFKGDDLAASDIFDVYATIDPGQGIVAVDDSTNSIIGSCFVHPRETHFALGIMNAHQEHFGRGVARTILAEIIRRANEANKPVRLVSSCFNLDSYSLYTRAGFVPFNTFQDMYIEVPENGLNCDPPNDIVVRTATLDDIDSMAAIELEVAGISRVDDYRYFTANEDGYWSTSVIESSSGVDGYLVSCCSKSMNMIGPGVSRTEDQAAALFYRQINQQRGRCPVLLAAVSCGKLVQQLYEWGARNCEMHVAQSYGPAQTPAGIIMPTFFPESG